MKPNPLLASIQAKHNAEMRSMKNFTVQFMQDMAVLAINRVYHAGPVGTENFLIALWDIMEEYAEIVLEDTPDGEYSRAKLDEALEPIMGHNFLSSDLRYGRKSK